VRVLEYLPAADVARVCGTCRTLRSRGADTELWVRLFMHDFDASPGDALLLRHDAKGSYARRLTTRVARVRAAAEARTRAAAAEVAVVAQERSRVGVMIYLILAAVASPLALILAYTVLAARRLDGDTGASWWEVGIPLWILVGIGASLVGVSICTACCRTRSRLSRWWGVGHALEDRVPPLAACTKMGDARSPAAVRVAMCCILAPLFAVPFVLTAKFEGAADTGFPWAVAFIPLFMMACCWLACAAALHSVVGEDATMCATNCTISVVCPLAITAALIAASIDGGKDIPVVKILIPLWIPTGLFAFIIVVLFCALCLKFAWDRDRNEAGAIMGIACAFLAAVGPPTLSLIFLVLKTQDVLVLSWKEVFAPLWAWLALLVLASLVATGAACYHQVYKPLRERWLQTHDPLLALQAQQRSFQLLASGV